MSISRRCAECGDVYSARIGLCEADGAPIGLGAAGRDLRQVVQHAAQLATRLFFFEIRPHLICDRQRLGLSRLEERLAHIQANLSEEGGDRSGEFSDGS